MIKIIKHGKNMRHTCYNCGCVFTYDKTDVKHFQVGRNKRIECVKAIQCPECGENNELRLLP